MIRRIRFLTCSVLLSACSPALEESVVLLNPPEEKSEPFAVEASPENTTAIEDTMEDMMITIIMPSADQLWNSVSYVATEAGITESLPDTDAEWTQLRTSALALIEAGNTLMLPGLRVGDPTPAAYQYTPAEIAQLLTDNPQPWQSYVEQLQETTQFTLQAIEFRDVMGLQDFGARINDACEGCHAQYWYRP